MLCSSMSVHHSWLTKKKKKGIDWIFIFSQQYRYKFCMIYTCISCHSTISMKEFLFFIKLGPLICALDYILSGMLSPALSTFPIPLDCFHYSWYKNNKILNHINVLKLTLWFSAPIFEKVKSWSSYLHFLISHSLFHLFFFLILFSYYTRM